MAESRTGREHCIGLVMEHGARTFEEFREHFAVRRNPRRLQERIDGLTQDGFLGSSSDGRFHLGPELGTVLVVYLGRKKTYAGIYDSEAKLIGDIDIHPHRIQLRKEQDLAGLLRMGVTQLAKHVSKERWKDHGAPRAMAVGLPAALDPAGEQVVSDDPRGWSNATGLSSIVRAQWDIERSWNRALPPFPRSPLDSEVPAIVIDTDIVMDTIGAMYEQPPTEGSHYPRAAEAVLGVKCSGGVRSTLIMRGAEDLSRLEKRITDRRPGERRDWVFRGRYGDTVGLGHSIALIHRSRWERDSDVEDAVRYFERCEKEGRTCSCGALVPHLESFVSHDSVAQRLRVDPDELDELLRHPIEDELPNVDEATRAILTETGRLLAYGLDLGVRLYDPEAVLVTGGVGYSDLVWNALHETADLTSSERRSLLRAADLRSDSDKDPLGPRGAARLAADTWIYPAFLDKERVREKEQAVPA